MTDLDKVDFFTSEDLIEDPYPYFDHLRSKCPVHREPHHDVMMVTGYEEAHEVYADADVFSSANSVTGPFPGFPVPLEGDDVSELIEEHRDSLPLSDQLPTFDPPKHTAHRGLLMRLLTPKRLRENEEFMWRLADRQLDTVLSAGGCEFVHDVAGPFTLYVIADLLGVPEEEHETYRYELQEKPREHQIGSTGGQAPHNPLEFLYSTFSQYIEDRRKEPRDDVLTQMAVGTYRDGSTPEPLDVARLAANLFAAGQETTVRLLGSAIKMMCDRPELQAMLRDDPRRLDNFVEETLRMESPVKGDFRVARRDTVVGGVDIPAGTTVMLLNGAANYDPRHFDEPHEFDIDRTNARDHLTFGRGIHACPGGSLARSETKILLQRLLERTSDLRIDEAQHGPADARRYDYTTTYILRGVDRLHIEYTPIG